MEHGSTWIAEWVNGTFGPLVAALLGSIYALAGSEYVAGDMIGGPGTGCSAPVAA